MPPMLMPLRAVTPQGLKLSLKRLSPGHLSNVQSSGGAAFRCYALQQSQPEVGWAIPIVFHSCSVTKRNSVPNRICFIRYFGERCNGGLQPSMKRTSVFGQFRDRQALCFRSAV